MSSYIIAAIAASLIFSMSVIPLSAFAHTSVEIEHYKIEVGWETEPPVVGIRNDLVLKITKPGETEGTYKGVTSAFKNLEATIRFGGVTKNIDINSDPRSGYYFSPLIPTKIGTYFMELKGDIDTTPVSVQIPIEDVEGTSVLDFPPTQGGSSNSDVAALKNAISSMQKDVSEINSGSNESTYNKNANENNAYGFAVFSVFLGSSGVILSIVAMIKRKQPQS